jgi:hypothetical protein
LFLYAKKTTQKQRGRDVKHWHFPMWLRKDLIQVTWVELKHCQTQRPNEQRTIITDYANWITQNSRNVLGISPWNSQLTQAFPKKGNPGSFILHCYPDTQTGWRKTEKENKRRHVVTRTHTQLKEPEKIYTRNILSQRPMNHGLLSR